MKFINSTLRPGRVLELLENGCIKAEAPGLFSREDQENLPPIMPFFGGHCNAYSAIKEGDEVWVLNQSDNYLDLRWIRKDDFKEMNEELIGDPEVEIIVNRETGSGQAILYFTDTNGWIMSNNGSLIRIRKDGSILIDAGAPHRKIDLNSGGISIGSIGSSSHPAVYGDELEKFCNLVCSALETTRQAASASPYTTQIGAALAPYVPQIQSQITNLSSSNVTID